MALRGNLTDIALTEVFRLLAGGKKTGVLRLRAANGEGAVWFRCGDVFFAQSDRASGPLGSRLVAAGRISREDLARALDIRAAEPADGRRLGEVLVREGLISEQLLTAFVQQQIQDTVFDLLEWAEADFDWESADVPVEFDIGLSVSMENILMESARRLERWSSIHRRAPSMDVPFKMSVGPAAGTIDIALSPDEWRVLLCLDGVRTVTDVGSLLGLPEMDVARTVSGLYSAGLVDAVDEGAPEAVAPAAPAEVPVESPEPSERPFVPADAVVLPDAETIDDAWKPIQVADAEDADEYGVFDAPAVERQPMRGDVGPKVPVLHIDETFSIPVVVPASPPQAVPPASPAVENGAGDVVFAAGALGGGLGEELAAITGADRSRARLTLRGRGAEPSEHGGALHTDPSVDRATVLRVIERIQKL